MIDQAARVILNWNTKIHDKYWAALHLLLTQAGAGRKTTMNCYPSHTDSTGNTRLDGRTSLLALGWKRVNAALVGRYPVPPATTSLKASALQRCGTATGSLRWLSSARGQFSLPVVHGIDWPQVCSMVYAAQAHEIRSFWGTFPWADNVWMVDSTGAPLQSSDFPSIQVSVLAELDLTPDGHGRFIFTNPCGTDPFRMRASQRQRLTQWLLIVVVNSGFHLRDAASWDNSRAYSVNAHALFDRYEWRFTESDGGDKRLMIGILIAEKWATCPAPRATTTQITASITGWGRSVHFETASGSSSVHDDLLALQDATMGDVILAGHPMLHHGPAMLVPKARYRHDLSRAELRFGLKQADGIHRHRAHALQLLLARLERAGAKDAELQAALWSRTTKDLHARAEGETDYQAIFRYRLALGSLNLRSNTGAAMPCPHAWCTVPAQAASATHVVWECAAAKRVWSLIHRQWTRRHDPFDRVVLIHSSLGVETPVLARSIRQATRADYENSGLAATATQRTWAIIQAVTPHHLWLHRNAAAFQEQTDSVHGIAAKIWKAITNQIRSFAAAKRASSATYVEGCIIADILRGLEADEPTERAVQGEVRLYYDGGARGNPGPSGAGSVLLERHDPKEPWLVVWWAATYLGTNGTNNTAEHTALAQGLDEAAKRYGDQRIILDIVGDSMLATRQLQNRMRTRNQKFSQPAHRSRTALVNLYDYRFHHTLRAGNKTADWLANYAMDTRTSTISTTAERATNQTIRTSLYPMIANDTAHSWTTDSPTSDVLSRIHTLLRTIEPSHRPPSRKRPRPLPLAAPPRTTRPHLPI